MWQEARAVALNPISTECPRASDRALEGHKHGVPVEERCRMHRKEPKYIFSTASGKWQLKMPKTIPGRVSATLTTAYDCIVLGRTVDPNLYTADEEDHWKKVKDGEM